MAKNTQNAHDPVVQLMLDTLGRYLKDPAAVRAAKSRFERAITPEQQRNLLAIIDTKKKSYPPALLVQLAYGINSRGTLDLTQRPEGARGLNGVAGRLGTFLKKHHVPCVPDAYQNMGKNTADLVRGHFSEWDAFLTWSKSATLEQLAAVFEYACGAIAATSRPVKKMPELDYAKLTFGEVISLFTVMLDAPSGGAHEQFIIAALLHALVAQMGMQGFHIATKNLNGSDASSRVAGDIQLLSGSRLVEAYEITANDWETKVSNVGKTIRDNDLTRLHIVAKVNTREYAEMLQKLGEFRDDVSVLEIRGYAAAITAALTKPFRAEAMRRLYEFLDRYQSDVARVNAYVDLLHSAGLVVGALP